MTGWVWIACFRCYSNEYRLSKLCIMYIMLNSKCGIGRVSPNPINTSLPLKPIAEFFRKLQQSVIKSQDGSSLCSTVFE